MIDEALMRKIAALKATAAAKSYLVIAIAEPDAAGQAMIEVHADGCTGCILAAGSEISEPLREALANIAFAEDEPTPTHTTH